MDILQQININDYIVEVQENGDIHLKRRNVVTFDTISNYDLSFSTITNCTINGNTFSKNNYSSILREIYLMIGSGSKIIRDTLLKIETGKIENRGFNFIQELGISVQGVDSNKRTKEILNQCIKNNISIVIKVSLHNDTNIIIKN